MAKQPTGKSRVGSARAADDPPWPIGVKLSDCEIAAADIGAALRRLRTNPPCGPVLDFERVTVNGPLYLADASGPLGGPLGPLVFKSCVFRDPIDLRSAHLQRLVLEGSRFPELMARDCQIESSLDLTGVGPLTDDPEAPCVVHLARARIDGSVHASGARLRSRGTADEPMPALSLALAEIHGSFHLTGATLEARRAAPLDLSGVQLAGHCQIVGGVLRRFDGMDDALLASNAVFESHLLIRAGEGEGAGECRIEGRIFLANVRVKGDLWVQHLGLDSAASEALMLQRAQIDGLFMLRRSRLAVTASGGTVIDALDARFAGGVALDGCVLDPPGDAIFTRSHIGHLDVDGGTLGGGLNLAGCRCTGGVALRGPELDRLDLAGAQIEGSLDVDAVFRGGPTPGLRADGARIGGDVRLAGQTASGVRLHGVHIRGELQLGDSLRDFRFTPVLREAAEAMRLDLSEAVVERSLDVEKLAQGLGRAPIRKWLAEAQPEIRLAPLPFYEDAVLVVGRFANPGDAADERWIATGVGWRPRGRASRSATVAILTGESAVVHDLNGPLRLDLGTAEKAYAYLAFFCDSVWGDEGAFTLVRSGGGLDAARWADFLRQLGTAHDEITRARGADAAVITHGACVSRAGEGWIISALVAYGVARSGDTAGRAMFRAAFALGADGQIEMIDDQPLTMLIAAPQVEHRNGLRVVPAAVEPEDVLASAPPGSPLAADETGMWAGPFREALAAAPSMADFLLGQNITAPLTLIEVDLSGAHLGSLRDDHGLAWNGLRSFRLDLTALSLDRIFFEPPGRPIPPAERGLAREWGQVSRSAGPSPSEAEHPVRWKGLSKSVRDRLQWLSRQFDPADATLKGYNPEPYLRVSQALARAGQLDAARRIESESRTLQLQAARAEAHEQAAGLLADPANRPALLWASTALWILAAVIVTLSVRGGPAINFLSGLAGLALVIGGLGILVPASIPRGLALLARVGSLRLGGAILFLGGGALRLGSDYFMSWKRALSVVVAVYLVGVGVTWLASEAELLVLEVPPVASVAYPADGGGAPRYGVPLIEADAAPAPPAPCTAVIDVWIYPLDMMTPLNLGQKEKCGFQRPPLEAWVARLDLPEALRAAAERAAAPIAGLIMGALKIAKPFYELLGWLVVTMLIVTATNVFRRNGGAA